MGRTVGQCVRRPIGYREIMVENLQNSLFAAGWLVLLGVVILLFMYIFRREYVGRSRTLKQSRDDLANMMILLQTMRDILDQQKQLARQLNASLDKKVKFIRESVDEALKDLENLRTGIRQAATLAQHVPAGPVQGSAAHGVSHPDAVSPESSKRAPHLTVVENEARQELERPALQLLALPKELPGEDDVIESWVGLDFGGDEPDPLAFDIPETPPEAPEDAEAAREAFRALLNLNPEKPPGNGPAVNKTSAGAPGSHGGNGKTVPPMHTSVYEYNDAGMTVAQIAQEMGIGKGEVRLILSLRKNRSD